MRNAPGRTARIQGQVQCPNVYARTNSNSLGLLLKRPLPLLIDGAVGTELTRRGIGTEVPLWSAHALLTEDGQATLLQIHREYQQAGAEVLVTNTFRTTQRTLSKAGLLGEWREMNHHAVQCARTAANEAQGRPCLVAGSIAPLEDCYRPDLVPSESECLTEHCRQIELLAEEGVDFILIETMNSFSEAAAALRAVEEVGVNALLSLCPRLPFRLFSGEQLESTVPHLLDCAPKRLHGVLLNCATPDVLHQMYPRFAELAASLPSGLYAHLGEPEEMVGWRFTGGVDAHNYAEWISSQVKLGAKMVGGCCGTTPEFIAAIRDRLALGPDGRT